MNWVVDLIPITKHVPSLRKYLPLVILVILVWGVVFRMINVYRQASAPSFSREALLVLRAHVLALIVFFASSLFIAEVKPSRAVLLIFGLLSAAVLLTTRIVFREAVIRLNKMEPNQRRVLIVGAGDLGRKLADRIRNHRELGLKIEGFLTDNMDEVGREAEGLPILGVCEDVQKIIGDRRIDQVFVALPLEAHHRIQVVLSNISDEMVDVKVVPDLYQFAVLRGGVEDFDGLPVVSLKETPLYGWRVVAKRIFDVIFSIVVLVTISPLMLLIALAVKISSRGPVFYAQERMGLDGRVFQMPKFRSMRIDAEAETGAVWASEDDPRRTRVGALLRRTSLDELPQFVNVLKGDMSVVGPRPERPVFIEEFRRSIPKYMLRHKVKAGITGWAQVNGWRGNTSLERRIEFDLYYIENWSFALDLRIIWLTVWKGLTGKNAY